MQVGDEINAHFAEQTLSNKNILERLVQKKQTLKDKILGFFRKARTDYQSDERLTGAAGEDSEAIRRETGWFVGYDNQWRYEIDDSAATLVEKPAFENHSTEDGGYRTAKLGNIMHHEKLYAAYPFLKDITVILQETDTGVDGSAFAEDGQIVLALRAETIKFYSICKVKSSPCRKFCGRGCLVYI